MIWQAGHLVLDTNSVIDTNLGYLIKLGEYVIQKRKKDSVNVKNIHEEREDQTRRYYFAMQSRCTRCLFRKTETTIQLT